MDYNQSFKDKLDSHHQWPGDYLFKFVVPAAKKEAMASAFPNETFEIKPSKAGNYASFSLRRQMKSSEEVMEIYRIAATVEGVIAL